MVTGGNEGTILVMVIEPSPPYRPIQLTFHTSDILKKITKLHFIEHLGHILSFSL